MNRIARRAVFTTLLAMLASGCLDGGSDGASGASATTCTLGLDSVSFGCVDPATLSLRLDGCVEAAVVLELEEKTFDLPEGFEDNPSATSPQRVSVSFAHCPTGSIGDVPLEDVTFGSVGVMARTDDRGQPPGSNAVSLEVLTSSAPVAEAFRAMAFSVLAANATILDQPALREVRVDGDVAYQASMANIAVQGAAVPAGANFFAATGWYHVEYDCRYYVVPALAAFTASQGQLAKAMESGLPLRGSGSQSMECGITASFDTSAP